jgi:signal transduction histidine kinase
MSTTEAEVRASRARIVAATHAARRSIERELHDGPQQHLVAMAVTLRLAESTVDTDPAAAKQMLERLRDEVQATIKHLRDLAHAIYPPLLADRGLGEALHGAIGRAVVDVDLTVAGDGNRRYPQETEAAVYFSCLEVIDAAKGPLSVWVGEEEGCLLFEAWGAVPNDSPALTDIADRVDTLGGTLAVDDTEQAHGLHLRAAIPLG